MTSPVFIKKIPYSYGAGSKQLNEHPAEAILLERKNKLMTVYIIIDFFILG